MMTTSTQRLTIGRENSIDPDEYTGPRPSQFAFDAADLYCYLADEPFAGPVTVERVIAVFEQDFHQLPKPIAGQMELAWNIEEAEGLIDTPADAHTAAAFFVEHYTQHYAVRGEHPPIGHTEHVGDRLGVPGVSETSVLGERTGYAIGHLLKSAWHRLIGTTDKQDTSETIAPNE